MPSVRVKSGYQHIDDAPFTGRPRSLSLAPRFGSTTQPKQTTLPRTRSWANNEDGTAARPPSNRPPVHSKVSHHIMSTRRVPRSSLNRRQEPETPVAGPSQTRESNITQQSLLHRHGDTYSVEGQQAELRVPTEGSQGLEGSQVNLALGELDGYDNDGTTERHHHDDIVEHLDVIGENLHMPVRDAAAQHQVTQILKFRLYLR